MHFENKDYYAPRRRAMLNGWRQLQVHHSSTTGQPLQFAFHSRRSQLPANCFNIQLSKEALYGEIEARTTARRPGGRDSRLREMPAARLADLCCAGRWPLDGPADDYRRSARQG